MTLLTLLGCYGDLSNAIFEEDARFYAALPSTDAFSFAYPAPELLAEEPAFFYGLTTKTMGTTSAFLDTVVGATAIVTAVPPAERGEDWRVWGPGAWDAFPGTYLRMEMSRTSDQSLYTFAFQVADTSAGPWTEFTSGTWQVDPGTGMQGELLFDYDQLSGVVGGADTGQVLARWDAREGRQVEVLADAVVGGTEVALSASILEQAEGGRFEFSEPEARLGPSTGFVTRWDGTGAGRADGLVFSDETKGDYAFTQCWLADGEGVFYRDDAEPPTQVGDEALCALADEPTLR